MTQWQVTNHWTRGAAFLAQIFCCHTTTPDSHSWVINEKRSFNVMVSTT